MRSALLIGLILLAQAAHSEDFDHLDRNEILRQLQTEGVKSPDDVVAKLPEFTVPDGLDAAGQRAAMEKVADRNHPVDALLRKAVTAPFVLKITDAQPETTMRRIDLWFVVYGDLAKISDEKFLKQYAKEDKEGPVQMGFVLEPEELKARGIELSPPAEVDERYAHVHVTLFDRVYVTTTGRGMKTMADESVVTASILDERFKNDEDYPNQWSPVERTAEGKLEAPNSSNPRVPFSSNTTSSLTNQKNGLMARTSCAQSSQSSFKMKSASSAAAWQQKRSKGIKPRRRGGQGGTVVGCAKRTLPFVRRAFTEKLGHFMHPRSPSRQAYFLRIASTGARLAPQ
jgi:hypothetical protein